MGALVRAVERSLVFDEVFTNAHKLTKPRYDEQQRFPKLTRSCLGNDESASEMTTK